MFYTMFLLPEQLILETRFGDSEVDDGYLDTHFREVVWVGHFGGHVKPGEETGHLHHITH